MPNSFPQPDQHAPVGTYARMLSQFRDWARSSGDADALVHVANSADFQTLEHHPWPLGRHERDSAAKLWSELFYTARKTGDIVQAGRWLERAACLDCVLPEVHGHTVSALLARQTDIRRCLPAVVRLLRNPNLASTDTARLRQKVFPLLDCEPTSSTEAARSVLRVATALQGVPGLAERATRGTAFSLCALAQGTAAGPLLAQAAESGNLPKEYRPLLAYHYFAAGEWEQTAKLVESWPAEPTVLGPAEPGARLRCGLALLRTGALDRGAHVLQGLVDRFGWVCTGPLSVLGIGAGLTGSNKRVASPESASPHGGSGEAWIPDYWAAAGDLAAGRTDTTLRFLGATDFAVPGSRQRWGTLLLVHSLGRALRASGWKEAHSLLALADKSSTHILPPWQRTLVAGLAGQGSEINSELEYWLWQARPTERRECLHAAFTAALCGSHQLERLARRAQESGFPQQATDLMQLATAEVPPTCSPDLGADSAPAPRPLTQASLRKLSKHLRSVIADWPVQWTVPDTGWLAPFEDEDLCRSSRRPSARRNHSGGEESADH